MILYSEKNSQSITDAGTQILRNLEKYFNSFGRKNNRKNKTIRILDHTSLIKPIAGESIYKISKDVDRIFFLMQRKRIAYKRMLIIKKICRSNKK